MQITLHPHARDCCCFNPHQFSWPFQLYCEVYFKFQIFDLFLDRIVTLILIKSEILVREHSLFRSIYNYCLMNLCVYIPACHWCACVYVGEHICLWRSQVSVSSSAAHSLGYMNWLMSSKDPPGPSSSARGLQTHDPMPELLHLCRGSELRSLLLHGKLFTEAYLKPCVVTRGPTPPLPVPSLRIHWLHPLDVSTELLQRL